MPPGLVVAWQAKFTTTPRRSTSSPYADHANLRVGRAGIAEDLGIAGTGMENEPALHPEAAIDDFVLVLTDGGLGDAGVAWRRRRPDLL